MMIICHVLHERASFMKKKPGAQRGMKKIEIFKLLPRKRRKSKITSREHFFSKLSSFFFFFLTIQSSFFFFRQNCGTFFFLKKNLAPPGYQMERPLPNSSPCAMLFLQNCSSQGRVK